MALRPAALLVTALFAWASGASAATPSLIRDLNTKAVEEDGTVPSLDQLTPAGSRVSFVVHPAGPIGIGEDELWTSDGTPGGTQRLRQFSGLNSRLVLLGSAGRVTFFLDDLPLGFDVFPALWRTDGTDAGTFRLTGPLGSRFNFFFRSAIHAGSLFFTACTATLGCELWTSDGTPEGTRLVKDITPGRFGSNPRDFLSLGGVLYFFANDPTGVGLWRTDGTREGTRRVVRLPTFSLPSALTAVGSRLFFLEGPEASFQWPVKRLWTSDGTAAGTRPVAPFDRPPRGKTGVIDIVGALGSRLIFAAREPVLGTQLWASDGTAAGTRRLTSFPHPEPNTEFYVTRQNTAVLGNRMFFIGLDNRLWSTGGTRASTRPLTGCPGGCPTIRSFGSPGLLAQEGKLYFAGTTVEDDLEPWVSDGTPAGTRPVADLCPGACGSFPQFVAGLPGRVFFLASGGLWVTDGTPSGTDLLADRPVFPDQSRPVPITGVGDRLFFSRLDEETGPELWVTDGTPEGTQPLARLAGSAGSKPQSFTPFGSGVLFFTCFDSKAELWRSDGTEGGTERLVSNPLACSDPLGPIHPLGGAAFFSTVREGEFWYEVWRTDGTPAGTRPVSDLGPEEALTDLRPFRDGVLFVSERRIDDRTFVTTFWTSDNSGEVEKLFEVPLRFVLVLDASGGGIFFRGEEVERPAFLWHSDGTAAGTQAILPLGDLLRDPVRLGDTLYFITLGSLWASDGTPEGTRQVFHPAAPYRPFDPVGLTELAGTLYFLASDGTGPSVPSPLALFRSDGTAAGTVPLAEFERDEFGSSPTPRFTALGGALYFLATDAEHGLELWRTDGTRAGTFLVRDIGPGTEPAKIEALTVADGRLWFGADDGEHGVELWTSDGTAAGTRLVADLHPGPLPSFPRDLIAVGNRLFFHADDGVVGREPWVLPLDSLSLVP